MDFFLNIAPPNARSAEFFEMSLIFYSNINSNSIKNIVPFICEKWITQPCMTSILSFKCPFVLRTPPIQDCVTMHD